MGLVLKDVDKYVGQEIHLKDINLELEPGRRYVLLGRTLAGKTSLLRIMAGLDRPTNGSVVMNDVDVTGMSVRKRSVAMVYQQFINYPSLSVFKNIASPLKIAGTARAEIKRRVQEAAKMLHIEHLLDRLPAELSGGQQQRCAIARALVKRVELLLLDEPLVNLDYKLREELREELQQIFERRESIVVYTTTEPTEALMLGGDIIVMHEGRILQTGPTAEVYLNPATTKVAEVFSDPPINFVPAVIEDGKVRIGDGQVIPQQGRLADLEPGKYRFGMRSNRLFLKGQEGRTVRFDGTVGLSEINGSETFVHMTYENVPLVAQEVGVHQYGVGDEVSVYLDPNDFYVFGESGNLLVSPVRAD